MIVAQGLEKVVNLGHDGSIEYENGDSAGDNGYELRLCTKEKDLLVNLNKLESVFAKCRAEVNESCGLHVHLDMRQRKPLIAINNLFEKQDEIRSMVAKHRLTNDGYCSKGNLYRTMGYLCRILADNSGYGYGSDAEKYQDISVSSYEDLKTFEVRIHQGSVDMKQVYNWTSYLAHVVDAKPLPLWLGRYVRTTKKAVAQSRSR